MLLDLVWNVVGDFFVTCLEVCNCVGTVLELARNFLSTVCGLWGTVWELLGNCLGGFSIFGLKLVW